MSGRATKKFTERAVELMLESAELREDFPDETRARHVAIAACAALSELVVMRHDGLSDRAEEEQERALDELCDRHARAAWHPEYAPVTGEQIMGLLQTASACTVQAMRELKARA